MPLGQLKMSTLTFELRNDDVPRFYTQELLDCHASPSIAGCLAGQSSFAERGGQAKKDNAAVASQQRMSEPSRADLKGSADRPQFNRFGQHEPATIRIRNIISQYVGDTGGCQLEELVKELLQNADDAKANEVHFVLDRRHLSTASVWPEWEPLQGPALCVINDSIFTENDIASIQKLGIGSKGSDPDKTGQFGIGFNVVYQLTDCPTLLSNGVDICMFDPHLRYVPGACDERPGGHVNLHEDPAFATKYADFMVGFLGDIVTHAGCTVFRLPLRSPDAESVVCNMGFADADIDSLEDALQSVDFRIFLHSALLFTKHVSRVRVSVICPTDPGCADVEERVCVDRAVVAECSSCTAEDLLSAYKRVSRDMQDVMRGSLRPPDVCRGSLTYVLRTWDDYVQNEWLITQNFGFHGGQLTDDDLLFLSDFFGGDDSKKFLPIAGVAAKLLPSSTLTSACAYSFLPLPVATGLPVHVNGHFAIHSSRRAIWGHTAYGQWNRLLRDRILAPAYCNFLLDAARRVSAAELKHWFKYFPDVTKASDEFFKDLVYRVIDLVIDDDLAVVPVVDKGSDLAVFAPPSAVLFACAPRNAVVEGVLVALEQRLCCATELALRFKLAGRKLRYLKPSTALACLVAAAPALGLPRPVAATPLVSASTVALTLHYVLEDNAARRYESLDGCPLCLTVDGQLRRFSVVEPAFLSHEFRGLIPDRPDLFVHPALVSAFCAEECAKGSSPVLRLTLAELTRYVDSQSSTAHSIEWLRLLWKLIKQTCSKSDAVTELQPLLDFTVLPVSDGALVKLSDGQRCVLNVEETGRQLRKVISQMQLPLLDAARVCSDTVSEKDVSQYASPFVLNAVLPEALLQMLTLTERQPYSFAPEECETLLQYFNLDVGIVKRNEAHGDAMRRLPIFEDVDGVYRSLESATCAIMDNCIPTHNLSSWMEQSDCTLLKEKAAYAALYESLGLVKKNAVEVYLDSIFPHFAGMDPTLRMTHLSALRTHIVPMLQTYASEDTQEKFWTSLRMLAFVPHDGGLLTVDNFIDPDVPVLTLLDGLYALEEPLCKAEWRPMLIKAGLRTAATAEELLACAIRLSTLPLNLLSDPQAHRDAQTLLSAVLSSNMGQAFSEQFATVRFIPPEAVPVDGELLACCPAAVRTGERICLRASLVGEVRQGRQQFSSTVLAWSIGPVLPSWLQIPESFKLAAQAKDCPSVADVVLHCSNLCKGITETPSPSVLKAFRKVISYILDYLSVASCDCEKRKCPDCAALQGLRDCPFVDTRSPGHRLVKPDKLVTRAPTDVDLDLMTPHVFVRPSELSKYDGLLLRIGAQANPTPDIYAGVLRSIWMNFGNRPLSVNDKQAASMAVYGLFTSLLQPGGSRLNSRPLYLPSDKAVMSLSTELVADDSESVARSAKTSSDRAYDLLCSLSGCGLTRGARELLACLPEDVRPQMLSDLVQERVIVGAPCSLKSSCPLYSAYSQRIHSKKFAEAMWLLARVPEQLRDSLFNDLGRLKIVEVTCAEELVGYLAERGRTVENTERPKRVHVENTIGSARLYMSHCEECPGDAGFVAEVATAVKSIICYNEKYFLDVGAISKLLRCASDADVEEFLVDEGLRAKEDDMSRPKLGTVVPLSLRYRYAYDPDVHFQPKEYVGYVKPKRSAAGVPAGADDDSDEAMVYARIIRESQKTESDNIEGMFREYDIDIGQGYPCVAQSLDLYREARWRQLGGELDDSSGLMLVAAAGDGEPHGVSNPLLNARRQDALAQEAKQTVTRLIEEVFADPRRWREREKLRRRLLLRWHPDKVAAGPGETELATEVFKHLQKEFKRVEDAYRLADESDSDEDGTVYSWEKRTEGSATAAEKSSTTDSNPNGEEQKDSDNQEAPPQTQQKPVPVTCDARGCRLWQRQATRDLACARVLHASGDFSEWACAACCEAVRKVMVAAVLSSEPSRLTSDLSSTRLLSRLHDAAICRLPRPPPAQLAADLRELNRLGADDATTRQPGVLTGVDRTALAPADVFTQPTAALVVAVTERIFEYMMAYANAGVDAADRGQL